MSRVTTFNKLLSGAPKGRIKEGQGGWWIIFNHYQSIILTIENLSLTTKLKTDEVFSEYIEFRLLRSHYLINWSNFVKIMIKVMLVLFIK